LSYGRFKRTLFRVAEQLDILYWSVSVAGLNSAYGDELRFSSGASALEEISKL
jgi:hypothetical protein